MNERPAKELSDDDGSSAAAHDDSEPREEPQGTDSQPSLPREIGGRKGPEPTRYGDWEKDGRCIDF